MGIPLKTLINEAILALRAADYQESTIFEYQKTFSCILKMADKMHTDYYSYELGERFRTDVISERTEKYSLYRWKRRNRCVQIFNWYEEYGCFKLLPFIKIRTETPATVFFREVHSAYLLYLEKCGIKQNTLDLYRNISCKFLQFLELKRYKYFDCLPPNIIHEFILNLKSTWATESLRTALSGLRSFLAYIENKTLHMVAVKTHALRAHKIIPVLSLEDEQSLWHVLNADAVITKRDKSITLLSLLSGLRACDIINLKLSDIDWNTDTISIIQQKTGKPLCLPLLPVIGNAIYSYISEERPQTKSKHVFLSQVAPYKPFASHSACYLTIKRVLKRAGVDMGTGICGTRLLRHNAASKMLSRGISIETIASALGHTTPESTTIYLTTDAERLRECVLPLSAVPIVLEVLK